MEDILKEFSKNNLLPQATTFLIWVIVILFTSWILRNAVTRGISDNSSRYRMRKVVSLVALVMILLLALMTFSGSLKYFSVTIGFISAGVAFALKEVILAVAGWISIFSVRSFRPGDRIEIGHVKGDVIDIGVTRTTLMEVGQWVGSDNYTGRIIQVSNATVFQSPVYNYSADFPFLWDECLIPIRYGSDIQLAQKIINDVAHIQLQDYSKFAKIEWKQMVSRYLIEDANVFPTLSMKLTDNWIEFNLRYVVDYKKRRTVKTTLFEQLHAKIEETGGKVKLASATFEVTDIPDMKVEIKNEIK